MSGGQPGPRPGKTLALQKRAVVRAHARVVPKPEGRPARAALISCFWRNIMAGPLAGLNLLKNF